MRKQCSIWLLLCGFCLLPITYGANSLQFNTFEDLCPNANDLQVYRLEYKTVKGKTDRYYTFFLREPKGAVDALLTGATSVKKELNYIERKRRLGPLTFFNESVEISTTEEALSTTDLENTPFQSVQAFVKALQDQEEFNPGLGEADLLFTWHDEFGSLPAITLNDPLGDFLLFEVDIKGNQGNQYITKSDFGYISVTRRTLLTTFDELFGYQKDINTLDQKTLFYLLSIIMNSKLRKDGHPHVETLWKVTALAPSTTHSDKVVKITLEKDKENAYPWFTHMRGFSLLTKLLILFFPAVFTTLILERCFRVLFGGNKKKRKAGFDSKEIATGKKKKRRGKQKKKKVGKFPKKSPRDKKEKKKSKTALKS